MTSRLPFASLILLWVGATLLLSERRWFSRVSLVSRLGPHAVGGVRGAGSGVLSVGSLRDLVLPLAEVVAGWLRGLGLTDDVERRLARVHAESDVGSFRARQVAWALGGLVGGALVAAALGAPPAIALLLLLAGPVVGVLVPEQLLALQARTWQRRLFLELPVVSEQLALLLSAGWSLGAALGRVSERGSGACARDLDRVGRRVRQGLSETEALREWAEVAALPAVDRLVSVLALHRHTSDLGRLLSEEARALRRAVHRELIESAERRAQQVWIPVTVATLVPGVVFLAIPFVDALDRFGG